MKLSSVHIREYKSIWDSNKFDVDHITCLVGKNEAGKTAILHALYRLNPLITTDGEFDVTDDYPRADVENYLQDIESNRRQHATVVSATFDLEPAEIDAITDEYGCDILREPRITVSKGYAKNENKCQLFVSVPVVEAKMVQGMVEGFGLPEPVKSHALRQTSLTLLANHLAATGKQQEQALAKAQEAANKIEDAAEKAAALESAKALAESEQAKALRSKLAELTKQRYIGLHIWDTLLKDHFPKFLYFDEYYQLTGHDNIEALKERVKAGKPNRSDHPLLGLIELARLDLDKLISVTRTQELKNKLQGASNFLSGQILKYWTQNKHLRMQFDVREALAGDPQGMQKGHNIWGEVHDMKHLASTGLGTRSRGFVWFFSFLAWYSAVKKKNEPLVLLLDEPGLSLHGKAQEDLLRYFEVEIASNPKHQLIYTTHSPFMVDPRHFSRVRIVQDKSIDTIDQLPRELDGTKVFTDVLEAAPDTLFPLQGALGYEIYQTLFIGPNSLIVEGVSDLLYIQTISGLLQRKGRVGLDSRWTITPVGGAEKVPTFVALIGSQKGLNVATLVDFQRSHQQLIENLYKKKLLKKSHVFTFADFTGKAESDIEDMFEDLFYLKLVNDEFNLRITPSDLTAPSPRILVRLEEYFSRNPLRDGAKFNHYRPARLLTETVSGVSISDATLDRFETAFKAANALLP